MPSQTRRSGRLIPNSRSRLTSRSGRSLSMPRRTVAYPPGDRATRVIDALDTQVGGGREPDSITLETFGGDNPHPAGKARASSTAVCHRVVIRLELQVSAHQSGSLITAQCSSRWPAGLWPADVGAPRRSRTYNPLAGSRVIRRPLQAVSLLVSTRAV